MFSYYEVCPDSGGYASHCDCDRCKRMRLAEYEEQRRQDMPQPIEPAPMSAARMFSSLVIAMLSVGLSFHFGGDAMLHRQMPWPAIWAALAVCTTGGLGMWYREFLRGLR